MRHLKAWAIALPLVLLSALFALQYEVLERLLTRSAAFAITFLLAVLGIGVFSFGIWRVIERAERQVHEALLAERRQGEQLEALSAAALALTADLNLSSVLQKVVDLSRRVIGARYGALAILGPGGVIEQFLTSGIDPAVRARLGPPPSGHGLLGVVIAERKALRVDDITKDPRSKGFPPEHPPMRTLLAVPVIYNDQVIGSLYLTERNDGQPFDERDQRILERFASHAAIAVANARLYAAAQRLSQIEERQRIAMDLHDGVLQSIYGVSLLLQSCLARVHEEPEAVRAELEAAIGRLDSVAADIRHYVLDLREERLKGDGFVRLLQGLLDSIVAGPELQKNFVSRGNFGDVPRKQQWELWHVAHEALSNAVRHGRPRRIDLYLTRENGRLRLAVQDDGIGFDPEQLSGDGHQGLANMRRRVAALGGQLTVLSAPGRGTTVLADVPVPEGGDESGG